MLREIRIRNYALIDDLTLELGRGLNVITGETGAGKTILFDALALLLGGKVTRSAVRKGADAAILQGLFDVTDVNDFTGREYADEEGTLLIERKIPRVGRGRVEANGRLLPMDRLREWSDCLVDFHGQQEKESLIRTASQRAYLDSFARSAPQLERFQTALDDMRASRIACEEEEERIGSIREREDFLRWQIREIDGASLQEGEEEELDGKSRILSEAERLREAIYFVRDSLREGDRSAVDLIGEASEKLSRFADHGGEAPAASEACERALAEIEEALAAVDRLARQIDVPPGELEKIIERLEVIAALRRKYRKSVREILELRTIAGEELELLDRSEEALRDLQEKARSKGVTAAGEADKLSARRKEKGALLSREIEKGLAHLAFRGARFDIRIGREESADGEIEWEGKRFRVDRSGIDRVEFLLAANRGEDLLPLRKVASGGELSRVMLALKRVLTDAAQVPTALFDEIDAGVGGDVAERIGEALREVSTGRQVICITHFPAIASLANLHVRVEKKMLGRRTVIRAGQLDAEERVEELVRMMGGVSRRSVSVPHAEEIFRSGQG